MCLYCKSPSLTCLQVHSAPRCLHSVYILLYVYIVYFGLLRTMFLSYTLPFKFWPMITTTYINRVYDILSIAVYTTCSTLLPFVSILRLLLLSTPLVRCMTLVCKWLTRVHHRLTLACHRRSPQARLDVRFSQPINYSQKMGPPYKTHTRSIDIVNT